MTSEDLERLSPIERLRLAHDTWKESLLFTSSFGAQSAVLLHMWSVVAPRRAVVFLDTGFLFPETHAYKDALALRLKLDVIVLRPLLDADPTLHQRDVDACCAERKVDPLKPLRALAKAWVSGLRRDQSDARRATPILVVEPDGIIKVHPIASMTKLDIATYMRDHELPEHPLVAKRFLSIGCTHCTRAVAEGEDERSGRWAGTAKTECGLHVRDGGGGERQRREGGDSMSPLPGRLVRA